MADDRDEGHIPIPQEREQGDRGSAKPESASKPGKHAYEPREGDHATEADQGDARGDRKAGNDHKRTSKLGVRAAGANGHAW